MKVIFLGTNGWYDTETGNTPCILIKTNDFYVVLDAGNGIYKLDQYIKDEKPIYVFISHLHLDHIEGLHTFSKFKFKQKIYLYIQETHRKMLDLIINHPFTNPFSNVETANEIIEINKGKYNHPFKFEAIEMQHADFSIGYRLYIDNKIISYSGDTATCKNSKKLVKNVDLLIHECSFTQETKSNWGHSKPKEVASLAKEMGVKKLFLTHFDPTKYVNLKSRKEAEKIAKKIFSNTIAATDGLEINI